jgi:hypothetical protein
METRGTRPVHLVSDEDARIMMKKDIDLTIQVKASTIEKLRDLNWDYLTKSGNDRTWNDLIVYLIYHYYF